MYRHACKKEVSARPEEANGDVLPLKLSNRADAFVPEKLITAGVNSGQEYDWVSRINLSQDGPDICYVDVNFTGAPSLSYFGPRAALKILHIRESLFSEKLFRDILRGGTNAAALV